MSTVLIVDDEEDIRELVRMNLELAGHTVIDASDGAMALESAVGEHPDCIVLDVMMPEKSGWQVLAEIKASPDPAVAEIPVIMLTAQVGDLDRIRGGIEGAVFYLTKPVSASELRQKVTDALSGEPEPHKRRVAQTAALQHLARIEGGRTEPAPDARPAMTHLTTKVGRSDAKAAISGAVRFPADKVAALSDKQRELLAMVANTPTVREAAERLAVSRSNVYASLRRIARRLDVRSVSELVTRVRAGGHPDDA